MNQKQRSNKEIMLLILFIAVVGWGVLNFSTLIGFVTAFIGMLKPFVIGAAMAFVINLPLKFIEEKMLLLHENTNYLDMIADVSEIATQNVKIRSNRFFFIGLYAIKVNRLFLSDVKLIKIPKTKYHLTKLFVQINKQKHPHLSDADVVL